MKSLWNPTSSGGGGGGRGGGGVCFSSNIQVLNADDTVSIRQMNPDGGFYDAALLTYEDDGSFSLGRDNDEDGQVFLDALQDLTEDNILPRSPSGGNNYSQNTG